MNCSLLSNLWVKLQYIMSMIFHFCHTLLCKCGVCCHVVSVSPSVTFVDSVKTNTHIFKSFSPSCSYTILVFPYQTSWQQSNRNPPNRGVECRLGRQKLRFWANIWLSSIACCQCCDQPGVINMALPDHGRLWRLSLVVSGRACWWRATTKCLWQEVSMLCQRLQNSI